MSTRLTIDLMNPQLLTLLRLEAARFNKNIRDIVIEALEQHFADQQENQNLLKLAAQSFAEWDNPNDAVYDKL